MKDNGETPMSLHIKVDRDRIADFCRKHHIRTIGLIYQDVIREGKELYAA